MWRRDRGMVHSAWHRLKEDGTGTQFNVAAGNGFYEAPTYTPGWHTVIGEVSPVSGNPADLSQGVRLRVTVDGVESMNYVEMATRWITDGGPGVRRDFWNVYIQGAQIGGKYVGYPDDPLGTAGTNPNTGEVYNRCLISGTHPNSCATTGAGGYQVIRMGAPGSTATALGDAAVTFEIDHIRVYEWLP